MHLRPLGTIGLRVSPLGLGTVKLGRNQGVKYRGEFDLPSDQAALALLQTAADLGINLLDTAPAYGTSEERLGALLPQAGGRDRWVLCTKAGEEFENGQSRFDFSAAAVTASVERSLRRLRTDRIEVVLLHSGGDDEQSLLSGGGVEALRRLKQQGKVRAIGASTKTPAGALFAAATLDVVMLTINPDYAGDLPAAQAAHQRGVGVLVKKALQSGHADAPGEAISYALGVPGVSSVVVGTLNPEHLRSNAEAAGL